MLVFKANVNQVWLGRTVRHFRSGTSETDTLSTGVYSRCESSFRLHHSETFVEFSSNLWENVCDTSLWFFLTMKRWYWSSSVQKCMNYAERCWNENSRSKIWSSRSCIVCWGTGSDGALSDQQCCYADFFFPLVNYMHLSIQYLPFSSIPFV